MNHHELIDCSDFISVYDPTIDKMYYGGNQSWYLSNTRARAGCGPVSATNILLCFAKNSPLYAEKLDIKFQQGTIVSMQNYLFLMNDVYETMKTWEVPILGKIYDHCKRNNAFFQKISPNNGRSICGYIRGTLKYARKHSIYLKSYALPAAFCDYENAFCFIKQGLSASGCVGMLTSYNQHFLSLFGDDCRNIDDSCLTKKIMRNHFVTITGMIAGDTPKLLVSTWGRMAIIDYEELFTSWQSRKALDSALIYFTGDASPEDTKNSIKGAAQVICTAIYQSLFKKTRTPFTH